MIPVRSGTGWLIACIPCRWEHYTERIRSADKAAREHLKTHHKENN